MNGLYKLILGLVLGRAAESVLKSGGDKLAESGKAAAKKQLGKLKNMISGANNRNTVEPLRYDGEKVIVSVPMPGMSRSDITVDVDRANYSLDVRARRVMSKKTVAGDEREEMIIEKSFHLHAGLDFDGMRDELEDGVFMITIPVKRKPTAVNTRGVRSRSGSNTGKEGVKSRPS